MEVWIIRHAIAQDASPDVPDSDRALTGRGRKRFRVAVDGLRNLGVEAGCVLHSPWLRAAQTAELLTPLLPQADGTVIPCPLLCASPASDLLSMIAVHAEAGSVLIVGHEPWLGELVGWLAFGDPRHGESLRIKKGGAIRLGGTPIPGGMVVLGAFPPRVLRGLA